MNAVAARLRPIERAAARVRARPVGRVATVAVVLVLMALSALLRTRAMDAAFWIDEAISVGVSSYPFFEVPRVLRLDGSPPLYYLMLNLWMQAFGDTETATHALSLVFSLLSIPVALWAARTVFGERAGWIAAGLAAINPFLTYYAQETRMYSLAAVLSLVVTASFLRAFAMRDRRYLPVFAVSLAAMLYTHNWAIFLTAGSLVAGGVLWRWAAPEERRGLVRDGLLAYTGALILWLPWIPSLVHQVRYTGAPWSSRPSVEQLLGSAGWVLGGTGLAIAILLVAGNGLAMMIRERGDRRALALVTLTFSAILVAWLASQLSPAFANRYFASFVGPLLLVAAVGLSVAGRLGVICLAIVVFFWLDPRTSTLKAKSNVRSVSQSIATLVNPGDLIVSTHPEQLPLISYYMPKGVRYANSLGPVEDPRVFDWTDATERLKATRPAATIDGLLRTLEPGQELVLVQPLLRTGRWRAPWTSLVRRRAVQWERRLNADGRVRREAVVPVFGYDPLPRGVRAVVYRVREPRR